MLLLIDHLHLIGGATAHVRRHVMALRVETAGKEVGLRTRIAARLRLRVEALWWALLVNRAAHYADGLLCAWVGGHELVRLVMPLLRLLLHLLLLGLFFVAALQEGLGLGTLLGVSPLRLGVVEGAVSTASAFNVFDNLLALLATVRL